MEISSGIVVLAVLAAVVLLMFFLSLVFVGIVGLKMVH